MHILQQLPPLRGVRGRVLLQLCQPAFVVADLALLGHEEQRFLAVLHGQAAREEGALAGDLVPATVLSTCHHLFSAVSLSGGAELQSTGGGAKWGRCWVASSGKATLNGAWRS